MVYFNDKFKKTRLDQSPYLFHFIKGQNQSPAETLKKILEEQKLLSSRGFVCFSASPLTAIKKFFEVVTQRNGRPLYYPWGIGFSRDILVRDFCARNVIYTDGSEEIPESLKWRTEKLDVDCYDFEYLREWRIKGKEFDFSKFPEENIIVVAPDISKLNYLVVGFDLEYIPCINPFNGNVDWNCEEKFTRNWKGIAVDQVGEYLDDYAISGDTVSQVIGENMLPKLLSKIPLLVPSCKEE